MDTIFGFVGDAFIFFVASRETKGPPVYCTYLYCVRGVQKMYED